MSESSESPKATTTLTEAEFAVLYPRLHRFACATADLDVDPSDLLQEALTLYLRRAERGAVDRPEAYIQRIILNLAQSHRRTAASRRSRRPEAAATTHHDAYPSEALSVVGSLSPTDRALLVLTSVEGLSIAEAAAAVGISHVAARARVSRSTRRLRRTASE